MTTSDELKGEELVASVCAASGWELVTGLPLLEDPLPDHDTYAIEPSPLYGRDMVYRIGPSYQGQYRPDYDIAQAWELDGEGWQWMFSERLGGVSFEFGSYAGNLLVRLWTKDDICSYDVAVNPADFATKAQAYATARCRAYLKGMGK